MYCCIWYQVPCGEMSPETTAIQVSVSHSAKPTVDAGYPPPAHRDEYHIYMSSFSAIESSMACQYRCAFGKTSLDVFPLLGWVHTYSSRKSTPVRVARQGLDLGCLLQRKWTDGDGQLRHAVVTYITHSSTESTDKDLLSYSLPCGVESC